MAVIQLDLNGRRQTVDVLPQIPLLWVLRDTLGLTGTKFGCGTSLCGACTVHVDGQATRSCVTTASSVAGKRVTTIEGLAPDRSHPVQRAWMELDVPQCGYNEAFVPGGSWLAPTGVLSPRFVKFSASFDF